MVDQPLALFKALLPTSADTLTSLHLFVIKSGSPLHEHILRALPSLRSTLLHLSISTHWIPLPDSLVDLILSCTSLRALALNGLIPKQLHELTSRLCSLPLALDVTVPATFAWHGLTVESFVDRILREAPMANLRFLTATRRIESGSEEKEERFESRRGAQGCACVYEVTASECARSLCSGIAHTLRPQDDRFPSALPSLPRRIKYRLRISFAHSRSTIDCMCRPLSSRCSSASRSVPSHLRQYSLSSLAQRYSRLRLAFFACTHTHNAQSRAGVRG